ncbi:MAG: DUF5684 domain-containing protein [Thermoanaerobaculia bacterium]
MTPLIALMLQQDSTTTTANPLALAMGAGMTVVWLAIMVLVIAALWKIFVKAGEPGWAAIIPIYNFIVMIKIAGKPLWWIVLMLIPFVNFVVGILILAAMARNFGKGTGFAIGMMFLPFIFYPILAWGDATYQPQAPAAYRPQVAV